ncbi:short-chain dehydrogenase [Micromonospora globispora]|uniref:Short-chain dehydrogenase n=1 Tax=Micromonospora globispora TaxID=1450148 RepID=A0A317KB93_9ACTN|nr:short-chain dehydrogenase [Micromonospora globispora]RQX05177.1 short-chain dehydrogenase [Micromonospora globispora]
MVDQPAGCSCGVPVRPPGAARRDLLGAGGRRRPGGLPAPVPGQPGGAAHAVPQHGVDVARDDRRGRGPPLPGVRGGRRGTPGVSGAQPLAGHVALVTGSGSSSGIGFACARRLGMLGARVALTSTTERVHLRAAELEAEGIPATGRVADLTDPDQAAGLVAAAVADHGPVTILVNNAGMTSLASPEGPVATTEMSDEQWERGLHRNVSTAFYVSRAALPAMRDAGYGRIVNVASTSGPVSAYPNDAAYHAAKAAMLGLTRALAVETASRGVTVNAVAPGWIATGSATEHELAAGRRTPVGRSGTPEEVAAVVAFLAAPDAGYVTGQLIIVDGGNSIAEDHT